MLWASFNNKNASRSLRVKRNLQSKASDKASLKRNSWLHSSRQTSSSIQYYRRKKSIIKPWAKWQTYVPNLFRISIYLSLRVRPLKKSGSPCKNISNISAEWALLRLFIIPQPINFLTLRMCINTYAIIKLLLIKLSIFS